MMSETQQDGQAKDTNEKLELENFNTINYNAILQTQINTTIPQTNIISMIKQFINAVSQFLQMCRSIRIKFLSRAYMTVYNTEIFRQTCDQTNPSKFEEKVILRHILVQITFETRKT